MRITTPRGSTSSSDFCGSIVPRARKSTVRETLSVLYRDLTSGSDAGAYTTAIDTTLLRVVMVSVQDTILQRNLQSLTF